MKKNYLSKRFELVKTNAHFQRYFIATIFSKAGDGIFYITSAWLLLQIDRSPGSLAFYMTTLYAPSFLNPILGVISDRYSRSVLTAVSELTQSVVIAILVISVITETISSYVIYSLTFVIGIATEIYKQASRAILRELVSDDLMDANSLTALAFHIGRFAGTTLSGVLISVFGVPLVLMLNAATFVMSSKLYWGLPGKNIVGHIAKKFSFLDYLREIREGIEALTSSKVVYLMFFSLTLMHLSYPALNYLIPLYVIGELSYSNKEFGIISGAFSVGTIVSSLVLPKIRSFLGDTGSMIFGSILLGLSIISLKVTSLFFALVFIYFCVGFAYHYWLMFLTNTQLSVSNEYQGRILSLFHFLIAIMSLCLFQLFSFLSNKISIGFNFYLIAVAIAVFVPVLILKRESIRNRLNADQQP